MNYICTWLCADKEGEESIFPQTGQKSSSQSHQNIYWRCLTVFYITSKRFNKNEKHQLYTNVRSLPVVDGRNMQEILAALQVEVIFTDFKYKTPEGYFGMFQNQFYEFSILEYIVRNNENQDDQYMILDSDCIFLKPAAQLFREASNQGFLSFEDECTTDLVIHGLSRKNMKTVYEDLLGQEINEIPGYHLGEFYLCSVKNTRTIFSGFLELWPVLMERFKLGLPKFNEEAHTLSYLYYKNGFKASESKTLMKRIWTNPLFYRNVSPSDTKLVVWHMPAEKLFGLADLYDFFMNHSANYGFDNSDENYINYVQRTLGIPSLSFMMKCKYYTHSYYRAIIKRIRKMKPVLKTKPALAN